MTRRHPNVLHLDEATWFEPFPGMPVGFGGRTARVGFETGTRRLGATAALLQPGHVLFPMHAHQGMEEAVFVVEGTGTVRIDDARVPVGPGDWVSFPRGTAHQVIGGDEPLRIVAFSTHADPEVVRYPDTGKLGAVAGGWPPAIRVLFRENASVGYWDDEPHPSRALGEPRDEHPRVARGSAVPWETLPRPEPFAGSRQRLARAAGAVELGASRMRVPAGRSAFPRHAHLANDEAILILHGAATVRLGDAAIPVGPGDFVGLPAGEAHAHRLDAGPDGVDYLVVSTMIAPDVCVYPDSRKLGVFARPPGGAGEGRLVYLRDEPVDYWDGEA